MSRLTTWCKNNWAIGWWRNGSIFTEHIAKRLKRLLAVALFVAGGSVNANAAEVCGEFTCEYRVVIHDIGHKIIGSIYISRSKINSTGIWTITDRDGLLFAGGSSIFSTGSEHDIRLAMQRFREKYGPGPMPPPPSAYPKNP